MKFWIYKHSWDSSEKLFSDMKNDQRVLYYGSMINNSLLNKIICFLDSKKINLFFMWNRFIKKPRKNEGVCSLYIGGFNVFHGIEMINKNKSKNSINYNVAYFTDINDYYRFDNKVLKSTFDFIFIFDKKTAEKEGINYFPLPVSFPDKTDIAFIGQSKGRVELLREIGEKLSDNGIKTYFYIVDNRLNKTINNKGIFYGPPIPHSRVVDILLSTNCILELKNKDISACTDRVIKAIVFNKKILTNNNSITDYEYYNTELVSIFDDVNNIDISFLKESIYKYDYGYNNAYSPIKLLDYIGDIIK